MLATLYGAITTVGMIPLSRFSCCEQSSQIGQISPHSGRRFGVRPSGCTGRGRLKPELQTGRPQRMTGRYEASSLYVASDPHTAELVRRAYLRPPISPRWG